VKLKWTLVARNASGAQQQEPELRSKRGCEDAASCTLMLEGMGAPYTWHEVSLLEAFVRRTKLAAVLHKLQNDQQCSKTDSNTMVRCSCPVTAS
jgi:hypothetical protein